MKKFFVTLLLVVAVNAIGHPGSGIVVDKDGNVYFTDTGAGVWKYDIGQGKLINMQASKFHWMAMDAMGYFADSQRSFGQYFERVTEEDSKPTLISCSDFPLTLARDGNIYYVDTRHSRHKIMRRTPEGVESVLVSDSKFEFINGITMGPEGSLYVTEENAQHFTDICKIDMNGKVSVIATYRGKGGKNLPLDTRPSYCRGLAVDEAGTLYIAATGNRSVIKITAKGEESVIIQEESPWTPTGVTLFKGEVYMLEWHDVPADKLEVRTAWLPRVRKVGRNGDVTTLVTIDKR